jgi:DNA (cytosine-5)-methyltransferase 1
MGAADVGANHQRDRIWIIGKLANAQKLLGNGGNNNARIGVECKTQSKFGNDCGSKDVANTNGAHGQRNKCPQRTQQKHTNINSASKLADTQDKGDVWWQWVMGFAQQEHDGQRSSSYGRGEWWKTEPNVGRVADGVAARVDRLKAIGNGQVPLCAAEAWRLLNAP